MNNNQPSYANLSLGQRQIISMIAKLQTPEEVEGVRQVVVNYLSKELDNELEKLWEEGRLTDDKIESFKQLHERTPYKVVESEGVGN